MQKLVIGISLVVVIVVALLGVQIFRSADSRKEAAATRQTTDNSASTATPSAGSKQATGPAPSIQLTVPNGLQIGVFAENLGDARDLVTSPGRNLLVSLPDDGRVVALPDKDNNGVADEVKTVISGLEKPHGIAFYNFKLYIAEEKRIVRYNWDEDAMTAVRDKELFPLPSGGRHTSRTLAFDNKGTLYIAIGSTCDVCFEKNEWISTIIQSNADGDNPKVFAKGLRNAVFIALNPKTNELWGTEMGRDNLGDTLPPDEINILKESQDYGWPVCYGKKIYDKTFGQRSPDHCNQTQASIYDIPAHSAPLGLAFVQSPDFPTDMHGDLLVAYHGSWNSSRQVPSKIVRMNIEGDTITGVEDFITGFMVNNELVGRPVDLQFDKAGSLFISDDKTGNIYKVVKQ